MATLISNSTGNWTTAGTWSLCNSTAELDSEAGTTNISTGNSDSAAFSPGIITVDGIAIKISSTVTPTGTFTCILRNSTVGADVATVTVNCSDLPSNGWVFFKFGGNQILAGATNYLVRLTRSVADSASDRVQVYRDGTAANHTRQLRTTTTQAPVAGDKLLVLGEHTGAGTGNSFTVTMNETATTDYGTSSTTLSSLAICKRATLTWGVAASTNYYLKISGIIDVYDQGTMNVGTVGTPIPGTSTAKIQLDSASNVDFGLRVQPGGTLVMQGASKTVINTLLTADAAAAATVLTVASTSGWAATDVLAIASTTRTASQCENKTISTVDSGTQVTLTAGLTNAHSGTSPTQAEVINLTRNVKLFGTSTSLQGYIYIQTTSTVDLDYVEIYNMGSATANKRGIDISTTTGTCSIQFCAIHDFVVASSLGTNISGASGSGVTFSSNVMYNIANAGVTVAATSGTWTIDSNVLILCGNSFTLNDIGGICTNNTAAGGAIGFSLAQQGAIGTFSGNTAHSGSSYGLTLSSAILDSTISTFTAWRNNNVGIRFLAGPIGLDFNTVTLFGNNGANITQDTTTSASVVFNSAMLSSDTTFSTTNGIQLNSSGIHEFTFNSSTFGVSSGIFSSHTNDIIVNTTVMQAYVALQNCVLASGTEVSSQTTLSSMSYVASAKHDQTAGNHKVWKKYGTLTSDTTIFDVSPSLRLTPNNASNKLTSNASQIGSFRVAGASGAAIGVSVKVRESIAGDGTDYNGNRIRLIVKRNDAVGITSDTVLATATGASEGAWETLSGTTASLTDDGVVEFIVDCDGTTGWINVDTFAATSGSQNTTALKYWLNGLPFVADEPAGAGAGLKSLGTPMGMF